MTTFTGEAVADFRALAMRRAILLWVNHGIKPNRAYTPGAMARAASDITGLEYTSSKKSLKKAAEDIAVMYPHAIQGNNDAKTA